MQVEKQTGYGIINVADRTGPNTALFRLQMSKNATPKLCYELIILIVIGNIIAYLNILEYKPSQSSEILPGVPWQIQRITSVG